MVLVVALKDFTYRGQSIHAGEAVPMRPIDAAIAARRLDVSLDQPAKATYKRRDLVAEPINEWSESSFSEPVVIPGKTKRKRGRPRKAKTA